MFEVRQAFDEYVQVFRNQIHQCTDELERKVQILLNNFRQPVCSCSLSAKGIYIVYRSILYIMVWNQKMTIVFGIIQILMM